MVISSRFLRKPWYIILENFESQLSYYQKLGCLGIDELNRKKGNLIELNYPTVDEIKFKDPVEQEWVKLGIPYDTEALKLSYGGVPKIKYGNTRNICGIIELVSRSNMPGVEVDLATEKPGERANHRFVQEEIYNTLCQKPINNIYPFVGGPIEIEFEQAMAIFKMAENCIALRVSQVGDSYDLKCLDALKRHLAIERQNQADEARDENFHRKIWNKHDKFWKSCGALKRFDNSRWICFQRTDGCNSNAGCGISLSPVEIKHWGKDQMTAFMLSSYSNVNKKPELYQYNGLVTSDDATKQLVIEFIREGNDESNPTSVAYFIMQMADDKHQSLMVGHYLYYSLISRRYISKVVIFQKFNKVKMNFIKPSNEYELTRDELFTVLAQDLNPEENPVLFAQIPLTIRKFFANRNLNRMTLPSTKIAHLDQTEASLKNWLDVRYKYTEDKRLRACCGKYHILYYYGDPINASTRDAEILQFVRTDLLEIKFDENYAVYRANYVHERNPDISYCGKASRKSETVEVLVELLAEKKLKTFSTNIVFLSFAIPMADELVFKQEYDRYQTFEGIISGLNDNELTPISFVAFIKKVALDDNNDIIPAFHRDNPTHPDSTEVASFFKANKEQVRIEIEAFTSKLSYQDLITIAAGKGYGCHFRNAKFYIKDFDGVVRYEAEAPNGEEAAVMAAEKVITSLPAQD